MPIWCNFIKQLYKRSHRFQGQSGPRAVFLFVYPHEYPLYNQSAKVQTSLPLDFSWHVRKRTSPSTDICAAQPYSTLWEAFRQRTSRLFPWHLRKRSSFYGIYSIFTTHISPAFWASPCHYKHPLLGILNEFLSFWMSPCHSERQRRIWRLHSWQIWLNDYL